MNQAGGIAQITRPDGGITVEHFYPPDGVVPWDDNRVYKTELPDGSVTERLWTQNNPFGYPSYAAVQETNSLVKIDYRSIKDAAGNLSKTAITEYQQDKNGNTTKVTSYDWVDWSSVPRNGSGIPTGVIPTGASIKRIVVNAYYNATVDSADTTTNDANAYSASGAPSFLRALSSSEVKFGAATDGSQTASRNEYFYDNASTTANLTQQKSWDSTKAGYSNPLSSTNSISVATQYNQYGSPVLVTDARGTQTQITYGTIGTVSDLYPTQIKTAYQTSIQRTENREYDFSTGLVMRVTDVDNNVSTSTAYDLFGRPYLVRVAEGKAEETRTATEYSDVNRRVIVRSDLNTAGDAKLVSVRHYDQLGRIRLARQLEDSTTQSATDESTGIKIQTRYRFSGSNSYVLTSNPYRAAYSSGATTEGTMGWTLSKSDNGGQLIEVQTFAGAGLPGPFGSNTTSTGTVSTAYDANRVMVSDQANRRRISVSDPLGRLKEVWEVTAADSATQTVSFPNSDVAAGYLTKYDYDTLGNLKSVVQQSGTTGTIQTRTFTYSSLARLLTAANPESGTVSYQYDNNGNLTQKTDARSITTTYAYDVLNRPTTRSYSDSTPTVSYFYDSQSLPSGAPSFSRGASAGRLVATLYGSSSSSGDYYGYDSLGRQKLKIQQTGGTNYQVSGTYNRAGALLTETYPSGHTTSFTYDSAARLNSFTGNLGDGVTRTYLSAATYSDLGGLKEEQFGTATPLYHKQRYNSRGQLWDMRLSTVSYASDPANGDRGAIVNYYSNDYSQGGSNSSNNGNLLRQENYIPSSSSFQDNFAYDSLNRLISVNEKLNGTGTDSFKQAYTYDRWGNRSIDQTNTTTNVPHPTFSTDTTTNRLNYFGYDNAGNQNYDPYGNGSTGVYYLRGYDAENRMTSVSANYASPYQVVNSTYTYDGDGHRVKRVAGSTETWQVYGLGGELVAEYKSAAPTFLPTKEYGYRAGQLLVTMSSGDDARLTRFVQNLYYGARQVDPTAQQLQDAVNTLAAAGAQGQSQLLSAATSLARSLLTQTSYESGKSDVQFVTDTYYVYLHRGPDTSGLNFWVNEIANGGRSHVCDGMEASGEFQTLVSTLYGTATSDNQRTDQIVRNFYLAATGIEPNSTQIQTERDALNAAAAQGATQVQAELESFGRGLFAAQVNDSNITSQEFVTNLYEGFLQRGPDSAGLTFWSGGSKSWSLDGMATSIAFRELAATIYRESFWLVNDHLGTPRMIIDKSGTAAGVKRHDYLPFGEEIYAGVGGRTTGHGYVGDTIQQQFTGQQRDVESALDYFFARYYSSAQGRFISPDSFGGKLSNPQSLNLYSYVQSNPLKWNDPSGHYLQNPDKKKEAQKYGYDFDSDDALQTQSGYPVIWETVTVHPNPVDHLSWSGYDVIPVVGPFRQMGWDLKTGHDARAVGHFGLAAFEGATLVSPLRSGGKFVFRFAQRLFVTEVIEESGIIAGKNGLTTTAAALEALATDTGTAVEVVTNQTVAPAIGRELSVATGDNAVALANKAGEMRGAGQLFTARIPKALIEELEYVGLASRSVTSMETAAGRITATEIKFDPAVSKYIVPFFK